MKILVINGPNLNMLGKREPHIYGNKSLDEIQAFTESELTKRGFSADLQWYQSNCEGEIVEKIHTLVDSDFGALVINPAAFTHTSVAIADALAILNIPIVEVHLSNTHGRESFRSVKLTSKVSTIIMEGLKDKAYLMAIISQLV